MKLATTHDRRSALADRGPLRVIFLTTSMPVGGAETLLVNLVRRLDRDRFAPEVACLKEPGPLGELLAGEIPVHCRLTAGKYDLRVLPNLVRLFRSRRYDAVVTVGAGDKMFWGRVAARWVGTPVVVSALHSTGWPDGIGRLNRMLTRWTDAFVGVAAAHGRHLVEQERLPPDKVVVIPNGVDTRQFTPHSNAAIRDELQLAPTTSVVGIVAALRPEKNHELFLRVAARVAHDHADVVFLIVGDGPQRSSLENLARSLAIADKVRFLGSRHDVPQILGLLNVFLLTSHNEANPVSILEAMSCGVPIVSADVGSIAESVSHGDHGWLVPPGDMAALAGRVVELLRNPQEASALGEAARRHVVANWSLDAMVAGYEQLLERIYERNLGASPYFRPPDSCDTMHGQTNDPLGATPVRAVDGTLDA